MADEKELQTIKQLLDSAENNIRQAKNMLFSSQISQKAHTLNLNEDGKIIEGVFDGEAMIGPDEKRYSVPANYASKSKLIPGDVLKLTIDNDGTFVFKQINPIPRKKIVGTLEEVSKGKFVVNAEGNEYRVLFASVTYFKGTEGDKVTIIVPEEGESEWAAIENLIESASAKR
jgi:hypothetical protein